jgi:hypothetical protein
MKPAAILPISRAREAQAIWENAQDSILHALEHFAELSAKTGDPDHHRKWIVLSVHHAAETFYNMLLMRFDPENASLKDKKGEDRYPSLNVTIRELLKPKNPARLTTAEALLLELLKQLIDSRNRIMHGIMPQNLDLSVAAMSILGLSRVAYRRKGVSVEDILQTSPPIQSDVVDAISYKKYDDYYRFVEAFLREEFPDEYFPECANCGASSIVHGRCEACFEESVSLE